MNPRFLLRSFFFSLTGFPLVLFMYFIFHLARIASFIFTIESGVSGPTKFSMERPMPLFPKTAVGDLQLAYSGPQSTFEHLLSRCDERIARNKTMNTDGSIYSDWYKFRRIILALRELGLLPDTDIYHFCHRDLYIDDENVETTGVLDWKPERTGFVPKFVALCPPFWLWQIAGSSSIDPELNEILSLELENEIDKAMKAEFVDLVDDEWKKYAFTPEYSVARRMYTILGMRWMNTQTLEEAATIIEAWKQLHYDPKLRSRYYFIDINDGIYMSDSYGSDNGSDE